MKIKVVSLIKRQEPVLRDLEEEYLKRIGRSVKAELVEIRREAIAQDADKKRISAAEARKIAPHLGAGASLVVLDSSGKEYNSGELSRWLAERMRGGEKELVFLIGGPLGLGEELVRAAKWKISLSRLTFPHKLARVILLESLYRALEIAKGTRYHK